ncbi:MAG: hypothetical protein QM233_08315 [Candidatus Cloacimonadota bacterium]|nr:hypothetical protein [Candidatus Cloacimonadota bacterium]
MNKGKVLLVLGFLCAMLVLASCGGNKAYRADGPYPDWYLSQNEPDYVCTYGFATTVNQRMSVESARQNALDEAARYVQVKVDAMLKDFLQEAGEVDPQVLSLTETASKSVASEKFSGVLPGKLDTKEVQVDGERRYTSYIQMKIPLKQVNKKVHDFVRNEEAMYSEFKATQAFKELERSIEKD